MANSYIALANLALGKYSQGYINSTTGALLDMKYLFVDRLPNTGLQWEKTTSWNVGLDLSFLRGRINASLEYYIMPTTDMIMNQSLPDFQDSLPLPQIWDEWKTGALKFHSIRATLRQKTLNGILLSLFLVIKMK